MKTYEEMAKSVLTRIEKYEIEKQRKRQKSKRALIVAVPVFLAVIAASAVFYGSVNSKIPVSETERNYESSVNEEKNNTKSNAENTLVNTSENSSCVTYSENQNKKVDINIGAESTVSVNNSDNENYYSEKISASQEDTLSSDGNRASNNENNIDPETTSSQTVSNADEEEDTAPERGFGYVDDTLGMIYKDGVMYMQFSVYDNGFTLDEYIGAASDFDGTYKYIEDVTGEVYTVKESPDVLIVKMSNGGTVVLAKAGQLIVNSTPYCSTMLDTNVYLADRFLGYVSDFEIVNVPYLEYEIELSPNDEVYTVVDKDEGTLCIKQENGNVVIFVSMW